MSNVSETKGSASGTISDWGWSCGIELNVSNLEIKSDQNFIYCGKYSKFGHEAYVGMAGGQFYRLEVEPKVVIGETSNGVAIYSREEMVQRLKEKLGKAANVSFDINQPYEILAIRDYFGKRLGMARNPSGAMGVIETGRDASGSAEARAEAEERLALEEFPIYSEHGTIWMKDGKPHRADGAAIEAIDDKFYVGSTRFSKGRHWYLEGRAKVWSGIFRKESYNNHNWTENWIGKDIDGIILAKGKRGYNLVVDNCNLYISKLGHYNDCLDISPEIYKTAQEELDKYQAAWWVEDLMAVPIDEAPDHFIVLAGDVVHINDTLRSINLVSWKGRQGIIWGNFSVGDEIERKNNKYVKVAGSHFTSAEAFQLLPLKEKLSKKLKGEAKISGNGATDYYFGGHWVTSSAWYGDSFKREVVPIEPAGVILASYGGYWLISTAINDFVYMGNVHHIISASSDCPVGTIIKDGKSIGSMVFEPEMLEKMKIHLKENVDRINLEEIAAAKAAELKTEELKTEELKFDISAPYLICGQVEYFGKSLGLAMNPSGTRGVVEGITKGLIGKIYNANGKPFSISDEQSDQLAKEFDKILKGEFPIYDPHGEIWYLDGKIHRSDGPAMTSDGKLNDSSFPSSEYVKGRHWYQHDKFIVHSNLFDNHPPKRADVEGVILATKRWDHLVARNDGLTYISKTGSLPENLNIDSSIYERAAEELEKFLDSERMDSPIGVGLEEGDRFIVLASGKLGGTDVQLVEAGRGLRIVDGNFEPGDLVEVCGKFVKYGHQNLDQQNIEKMKVKLEVKLSGKAEVTSVDHIDYYLKGRLVTGTSGYCSSFNRSISSKEIRTGIVLASYGGYWLISRDEGHYIVKGHGFVAGDILVDGVMVDRMEMEGGLVERMGRHLKDNIDRIAASTNVSVEAEVKSLLINENGETTPIEIQDISDDWANGIIPMICLAQGEGLPSGKVMCYLSKEKCIYDLMMVGGIKIIVKSAFVKGILPEVKMDLDENNFSKGKLLLGEAAERLPVVESFNGGEIIFSDGNYCLVERKSILGVKEWVICVAPVGSDKYSYSNDKKKAQDGAKYLTNEVKKISSIPVVTLTGGLAPWLKPITSVSYGGSAYHLVNSDGYKIYRVLGGEVNYSGRVEYIELLLNINKLQPILEKVENGKVICYQYVDDVRHVLVEREGVLEVVRTNEKFTNRESDLSKVARGKKYLNETLCQHFKFPFISETIEGTNFARIYSYVVDKYPFHKLPEVLAKNFIYCGKVGNFHIGFVLSDFCAAGDAVFDSAFHKLCILQNKIPDDILIGFKYLEGIPSGSFDILFIKNRINEWIEAQSAKLGDPLIPTAKPAEKQVADGLSANKPFVPDNAVKCVEPSEMAKIATATVAPKPLGYLRTAEALRIEKECDDKVFEMLDKLCAKPEISELGAVGYRMAGDLTLRLVREGILKKLGSGKMAGFLNTPLGEGLLSIGAGAALGARFEQLGEELRVAGMAGIGESLFVELIEGIADEVDWAEAEEISSMHGESHG